MFAIDLKRVVLVACGEVDGCVAVGEGVDRFDLIFAIFEHEDVLDGLSVWFEDDDFEVVGV